MPTNEDPTEEVVTDYLHRRAEATRVPPGDPGAVMARGRARQRRRRVGVTAMAALAAVSAAVAVERAQSPGGATTVSQSVPAATPGMTTAPAATVVPGLRWASAVATSGLDNPISAYVTSLSAGDDVYAVSTAPGAGTGYNPSTLYRSPTGAEWVVTAKPATSLNGLAVDGGDVYAVGTGPSTAATAIPHLGSGFLVSHRSGVAGPWTTSALPVDLGNLAHVTISDAYGRVAAGPSAVVAAVAISATLRIPSAAYTYWTPTPAGIEPLTERADACPAGHVLSVSGGVGAARAPAGTEVVADMLVCEPVTGSRTPAYADSVSLDRAFVAGPVQPWASQGVDPQLAAVLCGEPLAFQSRDGVTWQRLALPASITGGSLQLATDGREFAIGAGGAEIWRYSEASGASTAAVTAPAGTTATLTQLGYVRGRLLAVVQVLTPQTGLGLGQPTADAGVAVEAFPAADAGDGGPTVTMLGPSATKADTVVAQKVAFGPLGVAVDLWEGQAMASASAPGTESIVYSPDGARWSTYPLAALPGAADTTLGGLTVGSRSVVVTLDHPQASGPATETVVTGVPAA